MIAARRRTLSRHRIERHDSIQALSETPLRLESCNRCVSMGERSQLTLGAYMSKGILYDATLCIGCKMCEKACAEHNGLPYSDNIAAEGSQSDHKFTVVLSEGDKYMRRLCMHCE